MASERQADSKDSPWWGEHIHRYETATNFLDEGARLLDIACGTGFGSNYLMEKGFSVIGGDISQEAIDYCTDIYHAKKNLIFKILDGTNLPFESGELDAVVSFETIEHTTEYWKMLTEFNRVIRAKGKCIISTPNIVVNSPTGIVKNPYHTQEWNYEELAEMLNEVFDKVELYGQKFIRFDNKPGLLKLVERFLYLKGIRKLPLVWRDAISKGLIHKPHYPLLDDYALTLEYDEIIECKTFFAVCQKN